MVPSFYCCLQHNVFLAKYTYTSVQRNPIWSATIVFMGATNKWIHTLMLKVGGLQSSIITVPVWRTFTVLGTICVVMGNILCELFFFSWRSGLEQEDMHILYKYLTTSLFPRHTETEVRSFYLTETLFVLMFSSRIFWRCSIFMFYLEKTRDALIHDVICITPKNPLMLLF